MKNSPLTKALLVVVVAISLWSVYLCWSFITKSRDLRQLQAQVNFFSSRQQVLQNLLAECVEYSKKNPAINPILESAGVRSTGTNAAAPKAPTTTK